MLLCNAGRTVKDIGYPCLLRVKHTIVNYELVLDLDTLVLKGRGATIRKRVGVFKFNRSWVVRSFGGRGASLGRYLGMA